MDTTLPFTQKLLIRARGLINNEFRQLLEDEEKENEITGNQPDEEVSIASSKLESVKDARKRIRKEWEALKNSSMSNMDDSITDIAQDRRRLEMENEILSGVIAYIEVKNSELHTLGLKYILYALGAMVRDTFTREVTHVIFKDGTLETYKRAKLTNVHLVSVLWVDACRNTNTKVCEKLFPVFDTNDYSNSPRVFRRFMEHQPKSNKKNKGIKNKVLTEPSKNNLLIQNLKNLNICNPDENNGKSNNKPANDKQNKNLNNKSISSNESIVLHISTDESGCSKENSYVNGNNSHTVIDIHNDKGIAELKDKLQKRPMQDISNPNYLNSDVSPTKRRLFARKPIQESFVAISEDERLSGLSQHIVVDNPYFSESILDSRKNSTAKSTDILVAKKLSPVKQTQTKNINNKSFDKSFKTRCKEFDVKKLATQNRKKNCFNCSYKKNHLPYRPPSKIPTLVSTSLHLRENKSLKQIILHLGGFNFKSKVDKTTTHVVCGEPRRTVNLLKAVARGCWILNKKWVEDSSNAGCWLPEEQYEVTEFSKVVQRCRMQKQAFGKDFNLNIFDECGLIYISPSTCPSEKDLTELVTLCGGKLTNDSASSKISVGEKITSCEHSITERWILDSITLGRVRTISKYHL